MTSLSLPKFFSNRSSQFRSLHLAKKPVIMDLRKQSLESIAILSVLFAGVLLLCFLSSSISHPLFSFQQTHKKSSNSTAIVVRDVLEEALSGASMADKTVIVAIINKAYVEQSVEANTTMLDLFLESFWLGEDTRWLLDHVVLVAVDQTAYDRCKFRRLHCYRLKTDGVDFAGEKVYMSDDFVKMMWSRTLFLLDVLKRGYSFIFTDTDVMWLRNPFPRLSKNDTDDLQISTDIFNGDPTSTNNLINTGFYYTRSNNRTISLFQKWYAGKENSTGKKEQDILQDMIQKNETFEQTGIRVRFLDTLYFSGFCTDSKDFGAVTTVHANCCRHITAKVADLTAVLRDWKRYKAAVAAAAGGKETVGAVNGTGDFRWSGHFGCWNSWSVNV